MEWDHASGQVGGQAGASHETRKLRAVNVWSMQAGTWELVRQYRFDYAPWASSLYSDSWVCTSGAGACSDTGGTHAADPAYRKLTLTSVTQVGVHTLGQSAPALPAMTFTYHTNRGTAKRANGGWNRLQTVNNGQGGTITFAYDHIAQVYFSRNPRPAFFNKFFNVHRVKSKTVGDGLGNSYTWNYTYGEASVNTLDSQLLEFITIYVILP
jgi:hypothetical protein